MESQYETKSHNLLKNKTGDFFEEQMEREKFQALDDVSALESHCIPNGATSNIPTNVLDRIKQMYDNWEESFTWNKEILPIEWEKIEEYQVSRGLR